MKSFLVKLNGQHLCTAGVGSLGVLTAIVTWVRRKNHRETEPELDFHVSGMSIESGQTMSWIAKQLHGGDSVTIEIIDADEVDSPATQQVGRSRRGGKRPASKKPRTKKT